MADTFLLRTATAADVPVLADHRVVMFRDMGRVRPEHEAALRHATIDHLSRALPSGEYVGWVAHRQEDPADIVACAGVQLRSLLPRPEPNGRSVLVGREGVVLNVYVEHRWRRRGLARRLMTEILAWAPGAGVVRLVLNASADGRPLYEALGFVASNEMRYSGPLAASPAVRMGQDFT